MCVCLLVMLVVEKTRGRIAVSYEVAVHVVPGLYARLLMLKAIRRIQCLLLRVVEHLTMLNRKQVGLGTR